MGNALAVPDPDGTPELPPAAPFLRGVFLQPADRDTPTACLQHQEGSRQKSHPEYGTVGAAPSAGTPLHTSPLPAAPQGTHLSPVKRHHSALHRQPLVCLLPFLASHRFDFRTHFAMRSPFYDEPQTLPHGGAAQRRAPGGPRLSASSAVCVCPRAAASGPAPTPPPAPQLWEPGDRSSSLEQGLVAVRLGPFYPLPSIRNAPAHEHSQKAPSPPGDEELRNGGVRIHPPPPHTHTPPTGCAGMHQAARLTEQENTPNEF